MDKNSKITHWVIGAVDEVEWYKEDNYTKKFPVYGAWVVALIHKDKKCAPANYLNNEKCLTIPLMGKSLVTYQVGVSCWFPKPAMGFNSTLEIHHSTGLAMLDKHRIVQPYSDEFDYSFDQEESQKYDFERCMIKDHFLDYDIYRKLNVSYEINTLEEISDASYCTLKLLCNQDGEGKPRREIVPSIMAKKVWY